MCPKNCLNQNPLIIFPIVVLFFGNFFGNVYLEKTPPHIIVIIGDDMGWNDVGLHGSNQIPTPNIDALGYNGIILNRFYTEPTCTPSRAAFLTGNYPIRSGMQGTPIKAGEYRALPKAMPTMAEHLKSLGYATHLIGKWHLGAAHKIDTPTYRGFDTHFGYWNGFVSYFDYEALNEVPLMRGLDLHSNLRPKKIHKYATSLFTEKSLEILDAHNTSGPLFLVVSHLAAHTGKNGDELGVPSVAETDLKYNYIPDGRRRKYAEIVHLMDESIGRIVDKLQETSMLENSIILYFSDNGAPTVGLYCNSGSNWPFRGIKMTLLEGGIRGTGVIYSPLFERTNYINDQLMHLVDFLPTFYTVAGGKTENLGQIDGVDQWRTLSENRKSNRDEILLNIDEKLHYSGIISGDYKLLNGTVHNGAYDHYFGDSGREVIEPKYDLESIIESRTNRAIRKLDKSTNSGLSRERILELRQSLDLDRGECSGRKKEYYYSRITCKPVCLFDLAKDPCESTNIVNDLPHITDSLLSKLRDYVGTVVPQQNRPSDPDADPKYHKGIWTTWLDTQNLDIETTF